MTEHVTEETEETTADAPDSEETTELETETTETETTETDDTEWFDRKYVEKLRKESGDHRMRAKDRDDLAHRLHVELVRATGRLADPADLEFVEEHLTDPEALADAVESLIERKPHLAARRVAGDVGQGAGSPGGGSVDLAGLLRQNA